MEFTRAEWEDAYNHIRNVLGLSTDEPIPPIPRPVKPLSALLTEASQVAGPPETKRKAPESDGDGDVSMSAADASSTDVSKRARTDGSQAPAAAAAAATPDLSTDAAMEAHARRTAAYIPVLSPEILMPPKLPTREEMEQFLLELRKKALVEEYFGNES